jgi:beta-glucanase (GH16 family)
MVILVAILIMRHKIFNFITSAGIILVLVICANSCKKSETNRGSNYVPPPPPPDTTTTKPPTYTLVWSDEFNGTAVDPKNWNFETGSAYNNEKEYYLAANATVANGNLMITAKNESQGGYPYTSARMNSANKVTATYGRIEARIKIPMGTGLWPAFWMLGTNINDGVAWPSCGEIDIMEHINADSLIYGTMHWSAGGHEADYGLNLSSSPSDYHVYAVEWDTKSIRWYVDKTLYVTGNIADNINSTDAFHKPFFIILNLAVAGDFPGQTVDVTKLPATMYVDYVRVYKAN